ncbi:MAG: hypothetical protein PUF72_07115 [Clostridiales bacterium]|nr:hypothetical protein [Clostridiales bacterium]
MPGKIENFKEYARKRIVEKMREEDSSSKIEAYDEENSSYTGTEEDYRDFLNSIDEEPAEEPSEVENTRRLTFNSVISKVKETADKVAGDLAEVISKPEDIEDDMTRFERPEAEEPKPKADESASELYSLCSDACAQLNTVISNLSDISIRLQTIELKENDSARQAASDSTVIKDALDKTMNMTLDIKNTIGAVSKLNDSIFDLKNSQQNVKVAVSDMEAGFKRLKSKCVAGFTIISIIGLITIALEVINLLS